MKKPRSEEAKRRMLARRLLRAAHGGVVQAELMKKLVPDQPELHQVTCDLETAAKLLGVERELGVLAELQELQ